MKSVVISFAGDDDAVDHVLWDQNGDFYREGIRLLPTARLSVLM